MRAVTAVMKKALDYASRTVLKAAAIADLLIVIVLILKERSNDGINRISDLFLAKNNPKYLYHV